PRFCFTLTSPPDIYTLSLHDALPISSGRADTGKAVHASGSPAYVYRWHDGGWVLHEHLEPPPAPPQQQDEPWPFWPAVYPLRARSEEHTSELQSRGHLVCRLLLEKKK